MSSTSLLSTNPMTTLTTSYARRLTLGAMRESDDDSATCNGGHRTVGYHLRTRLSAEREDCTGGNIL